jgi:hypothetical protein
MTPAIIHGMVNEIRECAHDPERAHSMEDDLYMAVLRLIADGSLRDPAGCAAAALTSLDVDFPRLCA